jgi:osmotically inducible protein OsmC
VGTIEGGIGRAYLPTRYIAPMPVSSRASAIWEGGLASGSGTVSGKSSPNFTDLPVSWAARTEAHGGKTSPEELLAAAHASCFAMALSSDLGKANTPPTKLEVNATVTFDRVEGKWSVVSSEIEVRGTVPGADAAAFAKAAEGAKENCPISRALKGNVRLSVNAKLA